jgi:hypothetical protein
MRLMKACWLGVPEYLAALTEASSVSMGEIWTGRHFGADDEGDWKEK